MKPNVFWPSPLDQFFICKTKMWKFKFLWIIKQILSSSSSTGCPDKFRIAKNLFKSQNTEKIRESLFTFQIFLHFDDFLEKNQSSNFVGEFEIFFHPELVGTHCTCLEPKYFNLTMKYLSCKSFLNLTVKHSNLFWVSSLNRFQRFSTYFRACSIPWKVSAVDPQLKCLKISLLIIPK